MGDGLSSYEKAANTSFVVKAALRVAVASQWVMQLLVLPHGNSNRNEAVLPQDSCVWDAKKIVAEKYQVAVTQMHFSCEKKDTPVLHGPLFRPQDFMTRVLTLMVLPPMDPCLEALFDMICLGDLKERDKLMQKSVKKRNARQCPRGVDLKAVPVGQPKRNIF